MATEAHNTHPASEDPGYETTASTVVGAEGGSPAAEKVDLEKADRVSEDANDLEKPTGEGVGADDTLAQRKLSGLRFGLVIAATLSSVFLFSLDNTVVADVQPIVATGFDAVDKLPWFSVGFTLGAAATTLVWGKAYSQFDAKWLYVGNVLMFEVGSVLCGAAPNVSAFIIGRVIAGMGGVGMYIGVMTLLAFLTTMKERATYIGLTGLVWGIGTVLGPVIGGAFADNEHATWRWAFYINLCVGGVFAPVLVFLIPSCDPRPGEGFVSRIKHIDFIGTIVFMGATVAFIMAVCFGGILYEWNSGQIIALWVVAGSLYIILGFQQVFLFRTTKEDRIFPVDFLTASYNKEIIILFCCIAACATIAFTPLYEVPLYFQFTRGDSALDAGVRLLPLIITMVVLCIMNGAAMSMTGYYMPWYLFGGSLSLIGGALMFSQIDAHSSESRTYGFTALIGIGSGSFIQAGFSVAQAIVEPHNIPNATGFISFGQVTGCTIGLAIINSVLLNTAQTKLSDILPGLTKEQVQAAVTGVSSALFNGLSDDTKARVLDAIVESINNTYACVIAGGALVVVLSLFMSRKKAFLAPGTGAA